MRNEGATHIILEVTSHALTLNRVDCFAKNIIKCNKNSITYGINKNADVRALKIERRNGVTNFELDYLGRKSPVQLRTEDTFYLYNFLAAFSTCSIQGYDTDSLISYISEGIELWYNILLLAYYLQLYF